jgi:hypothetical protein
MKQIFFKKRGFVEPGVVSSVECKEKKKWMMLILTTIQADRNNILCWEQRHVMYSNMKWV